MSKEVKLKTFNDPLYGFIGVQDELIFGLIDHPMFQRLRRISQMGLSYLVFPGTNHTRFHHALGCYHLATKTITVLRNKGISIDNEEERALLVAALTHDIGHGPFSHALEGLLLKGVHHESLSVQILRFLDDGFDGHLSNAIKILEGKHPRKFLNQIISGQLDIDRMDYIRRDSFYAGVPDGNISSDRLIHLLNVKNGELVIEEKGIYPLERFLQARNFMYWQVYLHKTSLVAEQMLVKLVQRVGYMLQKGNKLPGSKTLLKFLGQTSVTLNAEVIKEFVLLDDVDVLASLKEWQQHSDPVISTLSNMILDRDLLAIEFSDTPISNDRLEAIRKKVGQGLNMAKSDLGYLVFAGQVGSMAYDPGMNEMKVLQRDGSVRAFSQVIPRHRIEALTKSDVLYYVCCPKSGV